MNNLVKLTLNKKETENLLKLAQNGDEVALATILELMSKDFYKIAMIKLKNEADAQDAVQETRISIYKNLKSLKEIKYFKTWAIKILINECNKIYLTRKKDLNNIEKITENYCEKKIETGSIDNKIYFSDLMEKLSEDEKIIANLFFEGYKIKDISYILNINENTVKTKIRRAKEKLKKEHEYQEKFTSKIKKVTMVCVLIIVITTGLVYASILLGNKIKKEAEPVKWDTTNIKMNSNEETIKNNMVKYNEETYILQVKDYNELKETINLFGITYEDNESINESAFLEHDYQFLFIAFLNPKKFSVANVLPYDDKLTIEFYEKKEMLETKNIFCIWIPKKYNRDQIEIDYKEQKEEISETSTRFKFTEFYIENIDEFNKLDTEYNAEQNYYSLEIYDINQYNELVRKLGLKTYRPVELEELKGTKMILIFRESKRRLELDTFRVIENMPRISYNEINEEYGKGITGAWIVFGTRFEKYNIMIK